MRRFLHFAAAAAALLFAPTGTLAGDAGDDDPPLVLAVTIGYGLTGNGFKQEIGIHPNSTFCVKTKVGGYPCEVSGRVGPEKDGAIEIVGRGDIRGQWPLTIDGPARLKPGVGIQSFVAHSPDVSLRVFRSVDVQSLVLQTLSSSQPEVRFAGLSALRGSVERGHIEPTKALIPHLISAVQDKDAKVRYATLLTMRDIFRRLEPPDELQRALPFVVQATRDDDPDVRREALIGISWGPFEVDPKDLAPVVTEAARDRDENVRRYALGLIPKFAPDRNAAIEILTAALKDRDDRIQEAAIQSLGHYGAESVRVLPALIPLLRDDRPRLRRLAVQSMGSMGEQAIPALILALKDEDVDVRLEAVQALRRFGPKAGPAIPQLLALLKHAGPRPELKWHAEGTLKAIGEPAVHHLLALWEPADPDFRTTLLLILSRMKPCPPEVLNHLRKAQEDSDARVRARALTGLAAALPPAEARELVIEALQGSDNEVKRAALSRLEDLNPADMDTQELMPLLLDALQLDDPEARRYAVKTLAAIGPAKAKEALPAIARQLDYESDDALPDRRLHKRTIETLATYGEAAVPFLAKAVSHRSQTVRIAAMKALAPLGEKARPSAAALVELLRDDQAEHLHIMALETLGEMELDDPAVIAVLLEQLNDWGFDWGPRSAAAIALRRSLPHAIRK